MDSRGIKINKFSLGKETPCRGFLNLVIEKLGDDRLVHSHDLQDFVFGNLGSTSIAAKSFMVEITIHRRERP